MIAGSSRPSLPFARWVAAGLALVLIGAALGAGWASTRDPVYRSTARVAFADRVEISMVDAERDRIVSLGEAAVVEAAQENKSFVELNLIVPLGRNFVDIDVDAADSIASRTIAQRAAERFVEVVNVNEEARFDEEVARFEVEAADLATRIAELDAQMDRALDVEAEAQQRRLSETDAELIAAALVDERTANDEYWDIERRKNSLIDQENNFTRDILELQPDLGRPFVEIVRVDKDPEDLQSLSLLEGVIGGAVLGFGLLLLLLTAVGRRD